MAGAIESTLANRVVLNSGVQGVDAVFTGNLHTAQVYSVRYRDRLFDDQGGKGGEHAISPGDVRQGLIGNCYFLSALESIAQSNPSYIRDMIRQVGPDRWGVTLYEQQWGRKFERREIVVARDELLANGALSVSLRIGNGTFDMNGVCDGKELWVSVVETAFHKLNQGGGKRGTLYPAEGFEALTGRDHLQYFDDSYTPAEVKQRLQRGEAVTVATGKWDRLFSGHDLLPENHMLMVKDVRQ